DHGEADYEARRLVDARVEAERILLATRKSIEEDPDLLTDRERAAIEQSMDALVSAMKKATSAGTIQAHSEALADATHEFAGRRMDRAMARAIAGRAVQEVERRVEHAAGIEAHLAEKGAG
ncbi:MAG TPA: Fe-S protein assembly chaperone HscA, partial [Polyangiaceae bacterium]